MKKNEPIILDIQNIEDKKPLTVQLTNSCEYTLLSSELSGSALIKEIHFVINASNIECKVTIKIVASHQSDITIKSIIEAPKGIKKAHVDLEMKAIVLDENTKVTFFPILMINEKEVQVNHKVSIGYPDKIQTLYMMSRGITKDLSIKLLCNSFLIGQESRLV
jgi:Fe-S cluster assembly scaffold protein SufB